MTSSGTHLVPVYTPTNMFPVEAVLCPDSASLLLNEQCDNITMITEYIHVERLVTILILVVYYMYVCITSLCPTHF